MSNTKHLDILESVVHLYIVFGTWSWTAVLVYILHQ